MFSLTSIFLFLALGAFVGLVAGMFGIGGGGVMVPLLGAIFIMNGFDEVNAVRMAFGTSMATIIITSFSSSRAHNKGGFVLWQKFWLIAPGVIIGTFLGSFIATSINHIYLVCFFSAYMFYAAAKLFIKNDITNLKQKEYPKFIQTLAGLGIGAISALVSIGGGTLSVPFLTFQGIDAKKAIGTSAAIGLPIAISGTFGYMINGWEMTNLSEFRVGYVNLLAFALVGLASYNFAPIGAKFTHKLPGSWVRKLFSVLLFFMSLKMFLSVI
ncbi:sulfite exporter TauE/SafE family protein [Campylobacter corcagiensis]|uniref:Probable membrane transporter protein n=1 Tax=Campylobacter corcagiensis TaxID=1448857 RepID=A0A7M1LGF1_9BACT|nr:sulfite exporter TauE/SafE family protein [Campylobacter corcagiensis]QKF64423.1 sulfite exporter TauE/SafE family protein [Campylobacter corcagiensis]QOQ87391.1 sulfite exporter TauE/SafE family protein [Campylobacter corcagiensis]